MMLPFLLGAASGQELQSAYLYGVNRNGPTGGTENFTIPAAAAGPQTLVFLHMARTNSTTMEERLQTVNLTGFGSMTRRAANDASGLVHNPIAIWTAFRSNGGTGSHQIVWDYEGPGQTVSAVVGIWVIYGRSHSIVSSALGGTISRPAGGIAIRGDRSSDSQPGNPGFTSADLSLSGTGNFVTAGRWFGPTAGSHAGGGVNINFGPT